MMNILQTEQLHNQMQIPMQELEKLSALVYDTDPFIYPALFSSRTQALRVLPQVFRSGADVLFNLDNCFIIRSQKDIVGLLLWHMGSIQWSDKALYVELKCDREPVASGFEMVKTDYFESYRYMPDNLISIINVCIAEEVRGKGIGSVLIGDFIAGHPGNEMELFVLSDNHPALSLYTSFGFQLVRNQAGFSENEIKPDCMQLHRKKI